MYKIVDDLKNSYSLYQYASEAEYEKMVVAYADQIFGEKGIYFDIKKRIGKVKKGAAIPDGYYLDLMFHDNPTLYFVEVELSDHDVYGHIGEQVLRFAISSEIDKHNIKTILIEDINKDKEKQKKLEAFFKHSPYNNVNELLDKLIFDNEVSVIIVIDSATDELNRVLSKIRIPADVIEAQSYICGDKMLHRFSLFQDEVIADLPSNGDYDELDTIVVPAREDGFKEEFIDNHRWYAIRISSTMLDKIKYIAAYQVAPTSAITHVAEVDRIEKYKDTNKYIVFFKEGTTKQVSKVVLPVGKTSKAPQAPRYTSFGKLSDAKDLSDLWG
jgi:hypothetical protein